MLLQRYVQSLTPPAVLQLVLHNSKDERVPLVTRLFRRLEGTYI